MAAAVALPVTVSVSSFAPLMEQARSHIRAAGFTVKANVLIPAGSIVRVVGVTGNVKLVDLATNATVIQGPLSELMYCPNRIPSGSLGIAFHQFDCTFNTTGASVGDPIYLATGGLVDLAPPTGKGQIIIGYVAAVGSAGTICIDTGNAVRNLADQTGIYGGSTFVWEATLAASATATFTPKFPCKIIDVHSISTGNAGAGSVSITNAGAAVVTALAVSATAGALGRATSVLNRSVAAAADVVVTTAANGASVTYITCVRT